MGLLLDLVLMNHQLTGNLKVQADVAVILATYNEADNIANLINDINALNLNCFILVVDDSSPDGTAEIVRNLQKENHNLLICERPEKSGMGSAITEGFKILLAMERTPTKIVTMDSDYSHDPKDLPQLINSLDEGTGIVIGSRYIKGGKIVCWPLSRKLISKIANGIARKFLKLKLSDCTSGFRCYSALFLKETVGSLHSQTYEIQIETVRQAAVRRFKVKEIPVVFVNRKKGKSKLSRLEIKSYISYIFKTVLHY